MLALSLSFLFFFFGGSGGSLEAFPIHASACESPVAPRAFPLLLAPPFLPLCEVVLLQLPPRSLRRTYIPKLVLLDLCLGAPCLLRHVEVEVHGWAQT